MPHDLRLLVVVPLAVAFAACAISNVGGGASTSTAGAGGGATSASGTGGRAMVGSSSAGGAGAGGAASTTSTAGAGGGAVAGSSSAGGAGAGGAASTTSTSTSTTASTGGFICLAANDCPGLSGPCSTPTCVQGTCGMGIVAAGMDALTQTPGDCQKDQCDGQGNVVPEPDPTDVPGAGNQCMVGSCVGGAPTLTPLTGASCNQNGGKVCDTGACVGCLSDSDCPGSNDCNSAVCAAGQCHLISNENLCQNPPPCYGGPALCDFAGCHYTIHKVTGGACPGGICVGGLGCVACAQWCQAPLPCHALVCDSSGPVVACTYPLAPQGTSCPGGTCDASGACL